jgi:exodeoxyribonuclease V alpha subunit
MLKEKEDSVSYGAISPHALEGEIEEKVQFPPEENDLITIDGTVNRITYQNDSNGYTVCEIDDGTDLITAVGLMPGLQGGELLRIMGKWVNHPSYGQQFSVSFYERQLPASADDILRYLSSGAVKGIGAKTAAKIVAMFGSDTFDVLENHPDYLTDIPGISSQKAKEINEQFLSQFGMRSVMMFCREFFGPALSVKIYKRFGSGAVDLIKQNPYILCEEINGIGFDRADRLAASIGFDKESSFRISSGLKYALRSNAEKNGHTFIPKKKLVELTASILDVDLEKVEKVADSSIDQVVDVTYGNTPCSYLGEYWEAEEYIARKLTLLDAVFKEDRTDDVERLLDQIQVEEEIEYAKQQTQAIYTAMKCGFMILTGGPGTGKTTIICAIIRIAERLGYSVALAAPTGRAAKRMSEATSFEAKTIHRLLEMKYNGDESQFMRDENNLLDEDLVIVDEASMIDTLLLAQLLKAIKPGSRLILIGDSDQLPSVGAGNVLCDLIACDQFPVVRLTEIFRQAQESRIVTNAQSINEGELPILDDKQGDFFFIQREESQIPNTIADLVMNRLPRSYGSKIAEEIQIITPSHKGKAGTDVLNKLLQSVENPPTKNKKEKKFRGVIFREGDKVMQIRNNYDIEWVRNDEVGEGIFNGDIGRIEKIDFGTEKMTIRFEDKVAEYEFPMLEELEHAYAITVHKSQGSEYPVVIIPMFHYSPKLLTRNLLYSAVTRAQKMVILVGRPEVVQSMVENARTVNRYTGLRYMIKKYAKDR